MPNKRKKSPTYTEEFTNYQTRQYLPGFYSGSNIHPMFLAKTRAGGYWLLLVALFILGSVVLDYLTNPERYAQGDLLLNWLFYVKVGIFVIVFVLGAIAILIPRKNKTRNNNKVKKSK